MSAPTNDATVTTATMTATTIRTVAVIGRKGLEPVSIIADDQTTSSPSLTNLTPNATTTSSTRRSSKAYALSTRTASTR